MPPPAAHRWSDPAPEVYAQGYAGGAAWRFDASGACAAHDDELIQECRWRSSRRRGADRHDGDAARRRGLRARFRHHRGPGRPRRAGGTIDAVPAGGGLAVYVELAHGLSRALPGAGAPAPPAAAAACAAWPASPRRCARRGRCPRAASTRRRRSAAPSRRCRRGRPSARAPAPRTARPSPTGRAASSPSPRTPGATTRSTSWSAGWRASASTRPRASAPSPRAPARAAQKTAVARVPMLCAISAPTGLAVRLAQACGLTLCAFVRGARFACFASPERLAA